MLRSLFPVRIGFPLLALLLCVTVTTVTSAAPAAPDATKGFLPLILHSVGGWKVIVAENFEGDFPGGWRAYDAYPGAGEYQWGKRSCRAYGEGSSGWALGGGIDGSALPCGASYPGNASSWLVYGPFSLEDATMADLSLMMWMDLAPDADDYFFVGASTDGVGFYGNSVGGSSGGWSSHTLDLANVFTLGNLLGEPEVWVGLVFASGPSVSLPEGVYVDDIIVRKHTGS